jgi:transcriptional regulator with XRE-family HTH domain
MEKFGDRLARLREERGWSTLDMDHRLKFARGLTRMYERGDHFPGYWKLLEIAKHLDVSLDYLCLGEE